MKKKISLVLIVFIILLSVFSTFTFATEVTEEIEAYDSVAIEDDEDIIQHDMFELRNEDYVMDQLVNGNAFIMANGDVRVTGEINGSAFIMANGTVEITENGLIIDSLYVIAKKVIISGAIYDIYSMSQNFEMTSVGYVERDVNILASNVKLRGEINRNANISAENIDVRDEKDMLTISGDFSYISPTRIEGLDEVVTYGDIKYIQQEGDEVVRPSVLDIVMGYAKDIVASIVYVLVAYFLFKAVAPKFNERVGKDIKEKSIVGFAIGLLSYVIIAIIAVLAFVVLFTGIGAPIAIFAWILLILGFFVSPAVFQIALFEIIAQKYEKIKGNTGYKVLTLIGISVCISVLEIIPYIGGIVEFVVVTIGLGLLVRNIVARMEKVEKIEKAEEVEEIKEEN